MFLFAEKMFTVCSWIFRNASCKLPSTTGKETNCRNEFSAITESEITGMLLST